MRISQFLKLGLFATLLTLIACSNAEEELTFESTWIVYEDGEVVHFETPDGESVDFIIEYTDQNYLIMKSEAFSNIHIMTTGTRHSMALERADGTVRLTLIGMKVLYKLLGLIR